MESLSESGPWWVSVWIWNVLWNFFLIKIVRSEIKMLFTPCSTMQVGHVFNIQFCNSFIYKIVSCINKHATSKKNAGKENKLCKLTRRGHKMYQQATVSLPKRQIYKPSHPICDDTWSFATNLKQYYFFLSIHSETSCADTAAVAAFDVSPVVGKSRPSIKTPR